MEESGDGGDGLGRSGAKEGAWQAAKRSGV